MTLNKLIADVRVQLSLLPNDEERRAAIEHLLDGFCARCGDDKTTAPVPRRACYCDPKFDE